MIQKGALGVAFALIGRSVVGLGLSGGRQASRLLRIRWQTGVKPERWLIIGKSLGTRAVCSGLPASGHILFMPLLTDDDVISGIQDAVHEDIPVLL